MNATAVATDDVFGIVPLFIPLASFMPRKVVKDEEKVKWRDPDMSYQSGLLSFQTRFLPVQCIMKAGKKSFPTLDSYETFTTWKIQCKRCYLLGMHS